MIKVRFPMPPEALDCALLMDMQFIENADYEWLLIDHGCAHRAALMGLIKIPLVVETMSYDWQSAIQHMLRLRREREDA